jgi:hypothetical protein
LVPSFSLTKPKNVSSSRLPGGLGPRTFPIIVFWAVLLLNAWLVGSMIYDKAKAAKGMPTGESEMNVAWRIVPYVPGQTWGMIFISLLFVFLWQYLGFCLVSLLYIAGVSWFLTPSRKRSIVRSLVFAGIFTLVMYILFVKVFGIPLPQGIFQK